MCVSEIRVVELLEGSPSAIAFAKLGIGLRFECLEIDESHPHYLRVRVKWQMPDRVTSTGFSIPHRDIALVALNLPPKPIGFHAQPSA